MSRALIERRLMDVAQRLKRAREELAVIDDQLAALSDVADEARIRSLVSETSLAQREYTEARRHADAMARSRQMVEADVTELQVAQDQLLDRLISGDRPRVVTPVGGWVGWDEQTGRVSLTPKERGPCQYVS